MSDTVKTYIDRKGTVTVHVSASTPSYAAIQNFAQKIKSVVDSKQVNNNQTKETA